ncbi:hypothetical protein FOA52_008355 [Chlamydomonas sp. UWO 241]|nr:hypothetical protein FOA52_008355 [Chlamydomonas sp. UWO 241]
MMTRWSHAMAGTSHLGALPRQPAPRDGRPTHRPVLPSQRDGSSRGADGNKSWAPAGYLPTGSTR